MSKPDKLDNDFDLWFSDLDGFKWLAGFFGAIATWYGKLSIDFLKNRNNELNQLKKDVDLLKSKIESVDSHITEITSNLIYKDDEGIVMSICSKLKLVAHDIKKKDKIIIEYLKSFDNKLDFLDNKKKK